MEKTNCIINVGEIKLHNLTPKEAKMVLNYRALKLYQKLQKQGGSIIFGDGSIVGNER